LPELLAFLKSVDQPEFADEYEELNIVADALQKGKVDRVVQLKKGLEAHLDAAQKRVGVLSDMLGVVESVMKSVVEQAPDKRIEGTTYLLRLQKNSRASVVIEDETKIQDDYREFEASLKVDGTDKEGLAFIAGVILGRVVSFKTDLTEEEKKSGSIWYQLDISAEERTRLEYQVKSVIRKSKVEKALKENPAGVSGAKLEQGYHLREDLMKVKKEKAALNG
jgi:hypothetical protein